MSDGCRFCYAETISLRRGWSAKPWTNPNAAENVVLHPERLEQPLKWRAPKRIFVNSMSDLFHPVIAGRFLAQVFAVMAVARNHTFQVLTKRPELMKATVNDPQFVEMVEQAVMAQAQRHGLVCADELEKWPLTNVWLGVSIEEDRWCGRADILRQTPAAVRFISAEPLLEPLPSLSLRGIDWLIVGGESGHAANERSMAQRCPHYDQERAAESPLYDRATCPFCRGTGYIPRLWARVEVRRLLNICRYQSGETAFFLKQWGGPTPKSAGNLLDGRTWEEFPVVMS